VTDAPMIDTRLYRDVMGRFATGVTVITAAHGGQVRGMTANAVSSLSLDPTLLLVCVQRDASLHAVLEQAPGFAVNILAADQQPLSELFARKGEFSDPMGGAPFTTGATGAPFLEGALGWFECVQHASFDGGDHTIFVGRVIDVALPRPEAPPLLFFSGRYRRMASED